MINFKIFKDGLSKIYAVTERNIKLSLQQKSGLILSFFLPLLSVIMPIIILGELFNYNEQFGQWTKDNFLVYQFLALNIFLLQKTITAFPATFQQEKYWETLPALVIAPFNRYNIIIGLFISHLILISTPFIIYFVLCYLYYPISITTIIFVLFLFALVSFVFNGLGIILSIFSVSLEKYMGIITTIYTLIFWFSCITYPYEIFPGYIQQIINLNPFYYIFDIVRLAWIEDNFILTITSHFFNLCLLIFGAILLPIVSMIIFNKIFR
ncbi:MAG: ABC transporter permease, partial [Candidatus Hermodarchaeota archaeon]